MDRARLGVCPSDRGGPDMIQAMGHQERATIEIFHHHRHGVHQILTCLTDQPLPV